MSKNQPLPGEILVAAHRESYANCRYVYPIISTMNQNLFVKPPVFHCGLLLLVLAGVAGSVPAPPPFEADLIPTAAGDLKPVVGGTYGLSEAAQAHTDLRARRTVGKLVLDPAR